MKILIATALIIMAGVAQADERATSAPPHADFCWNLKIGSMGAGDVYLLASIAKQYPTVTGEIQTVIKQMHLSSGERDKICKEIESVNQVQS